VARGVRQVELYLLARVLKVEIVLKWFNSFDFLSALETKVRICEAGMQPLKVIY